MRDNKRDAFTHAAHPTYPFAPESMLRQLVQVVVVAAVPLALAAQGPSPAPSRSPAGQPFSQVLSINPFLLPFGWFSGEYERAVNPAVTIGVGAAYVQSDAFEDDEDGGSDDARNSWVEAKVRYFPNERAPRGFSVGLTAGYHSARDDDRGLFEPPGEVRTEGAPTLGVIADYDWLLGRRRRFAVGIGIGFKRVLADADNSPLAQVYPDGRVQIGIAF